MKHKGILVGGAIVAGVALIGVLLAVLAAWVYENSYTYLPAEKPPAQGDLRCRGSEMQAFTNGHWYLFTDCARETQLTLAATPVDAIDHGGPKTCGSGPNACGWKWPKTVCCYYPLVRRD
ncbi:MAG: hypothetical protein LAO51_01650 [Acidobacteriia bacterium]|nr:hypothetical protein [Terriglobia bacterium]